MSDFENLLRRAKSGDSAAVETIYQMFRPLLVKNALDFGVFVRISTKSFVIQLLLCIFEVPDINLIAFSPFLPYRIPIAKGKPCETGIYRQET